MTLQKKLQINIVMSNYTERSGSYSTSYDYLLLDNLANSSYSNLFRNDLKNLKSKQEMEPAVQYYTFQVTDLSRQPYLSGFLSIRSPRPQKYGWMYMILQQSFQALYQPAGMC